MTPTAARDARATAGSAAVKGKALPTAARDARATAGSAAMKGEGTAVHRGSSRRGLLGVVRGLPFPGGSARAAPDARRALGPAGQDVYRGRREHARSHHRP